MKWQTDSVDAECVKDAPSAPEDEKDGQQEHHTLTALESKVKGAQQLKEDEKCRKEQQLRDNMDEARTKQAHAGKGGKGKGGKGGKGKGGKGMPYHMTADYHPPLPPLPKRMRDNIERMRVEKSQHCGQEELGDGIPDAGPAPPTADALSLSEEEFPALGMSLRAKSANEEKSVGGRSGHAAATSKFMRRAYGCPTPGSR